MSLYSKGRSPNIHSTRLISWQACAPVHISIVSHKMPVSFSQRVISKCIYSAINNSCKDVGTLGDRLHPLGTGRPAKECNVDFPLRHKEMNDCQWNGTIEHVVHKRLVYVKR